MGKNQAAFYSFCLGLIFSGVVFVFILRADHYQRWPKVDAQITQQEHYHSHGEASKVDIEYQYQINDILHQDDATLYKTDFNALVWDNIIQVAYNPVSPEDNIVYATLGLGIYALMGSVLMFFAMSIYYFVISPEHYEKLLKRHYDKQKS